MGKHRSRSRSRSKSRSRSTSSSSSDRDTDSNKWNGESGYRIHISDLAVGTSRREIEKVFTKYGPINEVWVASNPPCFAFVNFKHRSDAEQAIREVDRKVIGSTRVGVSWARTRTFGGRHRGGRGYASSSYRSSAGGGGRRRSRSRSRSNSRHRRRRSHSRDRHRRRSVTPKKRTKSKSRSSSPRRSRSRSSSAVKQKTTNRINESNNNRSPIATAGD